MQMSPSPNSLVVEHLALAGRVTATRYYSLDSLRATAMLLGVVYHSLLFGAFAQGPPAMPMAGLDPARWVQEWLHSFRMPLFFLISGFFGRMMFEKYTTRDYLKRRWSRIGIPLFVGIFTFVPAYLLTRDLTSQWMRSTVTMAPPPGGEKWPGRPPFANGKQSPAPLIGAPPHRPPRRDGGSSREHVPEAFGAPAASMPGPFAAQSGGVAQHLFGSSARFFQLHHLWFLWYLLLFVTVGPVVAYALAHVAPARFTDRLGLQIIRYGLAPLVLALLAAAVLVYMPNQFGWSLGLSPAIYHSFPDFLWQADWDMAFYFVFFLAGWWLHREREALPSLAATWYINLAIGSLAFVGATMLSSTYSRETILPYYGLLRATGCGLYCLGSATTAAAFLGIFLRYLNRPMGPWRYLADTALWVYLIHQPLVLVGLAIVKPLHLNWWSQAATVTLMSVTVALLLYELLVRPTPLIRIFGPASPRSFAAVPTVQTVGMPHLTYSGDADQ